ncbi:MAG: hypothetical protein CL953_00130 [Erythrobacteraceae bacterium]|nr:hypothetical protein [Erythrobacteraceae bacterium]|tara:strand:- start:689 stop:1225 length:537 start_codon:yes stop_codon:yes gene_type:complete
MLVASLALLTACDPQAPSPSPDETTMTVDGEEVTIASPAAEEPSEAPMSMEGAEGSTPEGAAMPKPPTMAPQAEEDAPLTSIPARFLGQWDAIDGPCDAGSEMFLTIRPGTVTFYESQGEVASVRRGNPGIVINLAMAGEGETWTSKYGMSLSKGGEELTTRVLSDSGSVSLRRRCPA